MYVDPVDQPPTYTTQVPYTFRYGLWRSLPAATYTTPELTAFSTAGCNHIVYAWADAGRRVAEDDEFNNVTSTTVFVGVHGVADAFEPDNSCDTSRWVTSTQGSFLRPIRSGRGRR